MERTIWQLSPVNTRPCFMFPPSLPIAFPPDSQLFDHLTKWLYDEMMMMVHLERENLECLVRENEISLVQVENGWIGDEVTAGSGMDIHRGQDGEEQEEEGRNPWLMVPVLYGAWDECLLILLHLDWNLKSSEIQSVTVSWTVKKSRESGVSEQGAGGDEDEEEGHMWSAPGIDWSIRGSEGTKSLK